MRGLSPTPGSVARKTSPQPPCWSPQARRRWWALFYLRAMSSISRSSAADVVTAALDALRARDWDGFARRLHPDVVHRTPGVPEPILGREAFVLLSRQAVARTPDVRFEVERLVTEGETVVVICAWTYTGLTAKGRRPSVTLGDCRARRL